MTSKNIEPEPWNNTLKVLLVSDPNLGGKGERLVRDFFRDVTVIIWDWKSSAGRETVHQQIQNEQWDLCLSFYNDFIFCQQDLHCMSTPLNIHPALPEYPGLGHDTLPLMDQAPTIGVTLHMMDVQVDTGDVLRVWEEPLSAEMTHRELRARTQEISCEVLADLCRLLAPCQSTEDLSGATKVLKHSQRRVWGETYHSRKEVEARVSALRETEPNHRALR